MSTIAEAKRLYPPTQIEIRQRFFDLVEDWARYPRFDALLTRSKKNLLRRLGRSKKSEDWNDILHELRVCASLLLEGADVDWELSPDSPDIRAVYDGFEFWIQLKFLRPYADEKVLQDLFRSSCGTLQQTLQSKESRLCITFQCGIAVEESQIDAFSARLRAIFAEMPSFIEESLGAWEAEMAKTGELIELALPADKLVQLCGSQHRREKSPSSCQSTAEGILRYPGRMPS